MASTYLTPTAVTRAAAVILHQAGKLLPRINRQYDAQYADQGRKAGGSVKIRMPNQYTVRSGATMDVQDFVETSETLTIGTQKGVDLNFSDSDLALTIEDFSKRILSPAIKRLVSEVEKDALTSAVNYVGMMIDNDGGAVSYLNILQARQKLIENLAPDDDEDLTLFLAPKHATKINDAVKGLYTPQTQIGQQFKSGNLQPFAGVGMVGVSTHLTDLTTGTAAKGDSAYRTNGAYTSGATLSVNTGSTTFVVGDVFEVEGVNAVHPETKADLGYRKQFAVKTATGANATSIAFQPVSGGDTDMLATGGRQNVSALPATGKIIYKVGAGNAETLNRSLYFHRDFLAIAFADLENPSKYGAWGDVAVQDNVSVRVWRQGDIVNGKFPARLDVYYGVKVIRPELACRIHADG